MTAGDPPPSPERDLGADHVPNAGAARVEDDAPRAGHDKPGADVSPRHRVRRRRGVLGVVIVLLVVVLVFVGWYEREVHAASPGTPTIVDVHSGSSMGAVTSSLAKHDILDSALAFRLYLFFHGTPVVLPGRYQLRRHESFAAVRAALAAGPNVFTVTVLPGFTMSEVAQEVGNLPDGDGVAFEQLAQSGTLRSPWQPPGVTSLEGLLGVGTYLVLPGETNRELLSQMIARFDVTAERVGLATRAPAMGVTPYQAVTVASIVQKEAISPGDSATATTANVGPVARVIYNRLARSMPLQMDSTVLYAEHRDGGRVTPADLALRSPYNTYLNTGLTPTPICFPSEQALQAAVAPPAGSWLYFVLTSKDGAETFSDTFAQQQAAEQLAKSRGLP